jgi:hypothetical protein
MGRFQRFVQDEGDAAESFDYVFPFSFGRQVVNITFLRNQRNREIKILINRYDE